jgi:hypothetical protein
MPGLDRFETRGRSGYDRRREKLVTNFTGTFWGLVVEHPGQDALMAPPHFESTSASGAAPWLTSSTCNRSYLVAAVRAGVIALVLLGILALIVLF